ncbi:acyl carrier protein [Paenibacillus phyllosphaerae]|uniref:Acyl carrier protein n=1 Tax=Paenibacillus phyllosphaerae TaxID=274593 RepID=A0A7W5FKK2_9BACL|nr:acyl carrier protein [Paenibacillus phyllosphaerae]MBB3108133.1 acyl carrier protein [Paenibacillus phyllosphaerae]
MIEKVIKLISEIRDDEALVTELNGNSDIVNETGMDSLQLINFILRIEDEFGIDFDFEEFDMAHLESIERFCRFIENKVDVA